MKIWLPLLSVMITFSATAQESPYKKFGKITTAALQTNVYSIDSSANAVVLSDIGEATIEGNQKGWFSVISTRHKVIHILNKTAYDEANIEIPLYTNGENEEKLEDLKAVTYNLEGGKIVETKLEKRNVFTEKRTKNLIVKKFTLPNVKEGSILEFEYKVSSDFIQHIDPWAFQGHLPILWSEFNFSVPQFFSYGFISHGYVKAFVNDKKDRTTRFNITESGGTGRSENYSFTSGVTDYRWVMKDVPELKQESFTSSLENHLAKIEFQLTSQSHPLTPRDFRGTWPLLTKNLLESEYFGGGINSGNGWLDDEVAKIVAGAATPVEKAKQIYQAIRDGFTCTDYSAIYAEQSLKNVFKAKKGSVAEINLLLIAMLRNAKLQADPVILSRSSRGYAYELYPMLSRFNYVVAKLNTDDQTIYLDASQNKLGFGKLLPDCYNGHARVINEEASPVYLMPDSLSERKVTAVFLNKGSKGLWTGSMQQTPGYYESYRLRNRIKDEGETGFIKAVQKEFGSDMTIENPRLDSLNSFENPIGINYNLSFDPEKADILYINPLFAEAYKKNPFKSAERHYPVEMPYKVDDTYILSMEVPEGYEVDELPKQVIAKLDEEGKSFFEYRLQNVNNTISLRSRIKLDRTYYEPEEYEALREFFNMVVRKHSEQIVFKKKK